MANECTAFPMVEQFLSLCLACQLSTVLPEGLTVVETSLRLQREASYGYVRVLWWLRLADGRSVLSVPPDTATLLRPLIEQLGDPLQLSEEEAYHQLGEPVSKGIARLGLPAVNRAFTDRTFACHAALLQRHHCGDCRRLINDSIPPAEGLRLPDHCFPDGIVYGVIADGQVASVAYAHRTELMEDRVADLGVETAPAYRRRGYAKTAVSAVVEEMTRRGGEALYCCREDNHASIATAKSVGFVPLGASLTLAAPWAGE